MSPRRAAQIVGMSEYWGAKQAYGKPWNEHRDKVRDQQMAPNPKSYADLDGGVRDTLKDFLLFRRVFLCRDETPWARDAANRTVEALGLTDVKTYMVDNMPPGSGKTTIFTHDLVLWLICGGGVEDPAQGRALRFMLGSKTKNVSIHYVDRLRRSMELRRPFYDKQKKSHAEMILVDAFGRFRPRQSEGEDALWRRDQFLVAQIEEVELYEKEPTVQAASRESGFLGERAEVAIWDDLVVYENSRTAEQASDLSGWFEDEAETRVEPGGVLLLVGQRISPLDLYRNRLDARYIDDSGNEVPIYEHIVYPAHNEGTCDGDHRQWDGNGSGCLLDAKRLSWRDLLRAQSKGNYRTVYQQEDQNPEDALVLESWIFGGTDPYGFTAIGCLDRDRGFWQWPHPISERPQLVTYATVDPAAGNYWAVEVWCADPETKFRWLIYGERRKMRAGLERGFLDWDPSLQKHVGLMEDLQSKSGEHGWPILVWVVEQNAAHRYLFQTYAYQTWRRKWPMVDVIAHQTQRNKQDEKYGVDALLPMLYRQGFKRLPYVRGTEVRNYLAIKIAELTKYPAYPTTDTVMADWFAECRFSEVMAAGRRIRKWGSKDDVSFLPKHLQKLQGVKALPPHLRQGANVG